MPRDPLCEICRIRPATVMIGRRRMDDVHRTLVCSECAGERLRVVGGQDVDLAALLSKRGAGTPDSAPTYTCSVCGATLADIIADGRPGCCACYTKFAAELDDMIQEYQKRSCHAGKSPS